MIVAPVVDGAQVDVVVQFFPVRVVYPLGPHFFNDGGKGGVLGSQRDLDMELQVPLGITEALLVAGFLLNFH